MWRILVDLPMLLLESHHPTHHPMCPHPRTRPQPTACPSPRRRSFGLSRLPTGRTQPPSSLSPSLHPFCWHLPLTRVAIGEATWRHLQKLWHTCASRLLCADAEPGTRSCEAVASHDSSQSSAACRALKLAATGQSETSSSCQSTFNSVSPIAAYSSRQH